MKREAWKLCMMSGVSCLMVFGVPRVMIAADQNNAGPDERLQRLEQRINELAERQERLMRRFGGPPERQGAMGQPGMVPPPGPMPQPGMMPPPGQLGQPGPQDTRFEMPPMGQPGHLAAHALHRVGDMVRLLILAWIVCNILLAVWIYTDIRKRREGPGILIVLALVAGIPAAIIYSLARIADKLAVPEKQAG